MLDVGPITGRSNARQGQHSLHKGLKVGIIDDALEIALEVDHVNEVKSHKGGEQTEVGFGENASSVTHQPLAFLEVSVKFVQPVKQGGDGRFVSIL